MVPLAATESLQVETSGAGPPVVLIPGLFGSEFGFRKLVPLLNGAGYRTIVVEPLGIGSIARPPRPPSSLPRGSGPGAPGVQFLPLSRGVVGAGLPGRSVGVPLAVPPPAV